MLTSANYYWCQVAVSNTHMVVLTAEGLVFTWGEGKKGQLGHGELETWRAKPSVVESLKGKSITRVGDSSAVGGFLNFGYGTVLLNLKQL